MEKIEQDNKPSLKSVLSQYGYHSERETGSYYVYSSPLRAESDASFFLRKSDDRWKDFGNAKPGDQWRDVYDFVQQYEECDLFTSRKIIEGSDYKKFKQIKEVKRQKRIEVVKETDIDSGTLIRYFVGVRKIDLDILRKYCVQLYVRFPYSKRDPKAIHKVVAMKNSVGSFAYRNGYLKGSGERNSFSEIIGTVNKSIIFEGFTSFLSMLTYLKKDAVKETVYVLNSACNVMYLEQILKDFDMNYGCLDNDVTGDNYTQWLIETGINFKDLRYKYINYVDFNDFICKKPKTKVTLFKFLFR